MLEFCKFIFSKKLVLNVSHIQHYCTDQRKRAHSSAPIILSKLLEPFKQPLVGLTCLERIIGTEIHACLMASLPYYWMWFECVTTNLDKIERVWPKSNKINNFAHFFYYCLKHCGYYYTLWGSRSRMKTRSC